MFEGVDVRVRMKPYRTLKQMLVNPKDPILFQYRVRIVYRVPCEDCPKCTSDSQDRMYAGVQNEGAQKSSRERYITLMC